MKTLPEDYDGPDQLTDSEKQQMESTFAKVEAWHKGRERVLIDSRTLGQNYYPELYRLLVQYPIGNMDQKQELQAAYLIRQIPTTLSKAMEAIRACKLPLQKQKRVNELMKVCTLFNHGSNAHTIGSILLDQAIDSIQPEINEVLKTFAVPKKPEKLEISFSDLLTDAGKNILPKIRSMYQNKYPIDYAYLVLALEELGYLDQLTAKTKIHKCLMLEFGEVGTYENLRITHMNAKPELLSVHLSKLKKLT